jgi:hypothetical protein
VAATRTKATQKGDEGSKDAAGFYPAEAGRRNLKRVSAPARAHEPEPVGMLPAR